MIRIIIGESERSGLPISAPLQKPCTDEVPEIKLRWRNTGTSFVLELWRLVDAAESKWKWVEIPCVESPNEYGTSPSALTELVKAAKAFRDRTTTDGTELMLLDIEIARAENVETKK